MYKIEIKTSKGIVTVYLDNLLKLGEELNKYQEYEKVVATKVKKLEDNR